MLAAVACWAGCRSTAPDAVGVQGATAPGPRVGRDLLGVQADPADQQRRVRGPPVRAVLRDRDLGIGIARAALGDSARTGTGPSPWRYRGHYSGLGECGCPFVTVAPQSLPGDDGRVRDPSESSHLQQAAQPGGSAAAGVVVIEITKQTFCSDVVQRSHATLVILYLWAKWCWPCHQLGPVLEKLAAESGGQWVLAKVDIDANPQLKAALQVQRIPMVAAVADGQLVDGFFGAMPEAPLRQWLG